MKDIKIELDTAYGGISEIIVGAAFISSVTTDTPNSLFIEVKPKEQPNNYDTGRLSYATAETGVKFRDALTEILATIGVIDPQAAYTAGLEADNIALLEQVSTARIKFNNVLEENRRYSTQKESELRDTVTRLSGELRVEKARHSKLRKQIENLVTVEEVEEVEEVRCVNPNCCHKSYCNQPSCFKCVYRGQTGAL